MPTSSWWMLDDPSPFAVPRFGGDATNVAIVGGGLAGWSCAYWLRREGIDCVVIDPDPAPSGASSRNAGFLMTGTAFSYAESIRMWGRDEARRLEAASWANREALEREVIGRFDCQASRSGTWRLAESAEEESELAESLELLRDDGFEYDWISRDDARTIGGRFFGGIGQAGDWAVHSRRLLRGIAELADAPLLQTRVVSIDPSAGGVEIAGAGGERLRAERCIVTLNGYARELFSDAAIDPVRAQVLLTEPFARSVWTRPVYSHYGYFYFRQLPGGRLLVGGARHLHEEEERGLEDSTTAGLQGDLEDFLRSIVPDHPPIAHRWSGVMGFTRDSRPVISRAGDDARITLLGGFNGHGVGLAFEFARQLVHAEMGGR